MKKYTITEEYITKTDDHIYKIATRFYLKWYLWHIIYDVNKDSIGEDPFYIKPGTKLSIVKLNTENIEHIIEEYDTYQSLAESYYGSMTLYYEVAIANNYKFLLPGEIAIIPPLVTSEIKKAEKLRNAAS